LSHCDHFYGNRFFQPSGLSPSCPLTVQLQANDDATKLDLAESVRRGYRRGYGQQAITAVAETLAESIKGAPPDASTYLDLATLIHYEHAAIYADTAPRLRELLIGSPSREQLLRTIRVNWS